MEDLQFKLDQFEGPLDLLLTLISKHKMNIFDIEISALLDQYLAYLQKVRKMDMEVTGDFLEMASRLIHIKTVSLLPKHDEGEQLKKELTGELIEYSKCKAAAALLSERFCGNEVFCRAPAELEADKLYRRVHSQEELMRAYRNLSGKVRSRQLPRQEEFTPIVAKRVVSVGSRIIFVLKSLYRQTTMKFSGLFEKSRDRSEMVATFLAVLELIKAGRVREENGNVAMLEKGGRRK